MGRRECVALLDAAFAMGVCDFDTASIYGQGDSERYLGEALQAHRGQVRLASKAGQCLTTKQALIAKFKGPIRWLAAHRKAVHGRVADQRAQGVPRCFDPDYIERSLVDSLKRLRTDHLDVFYLHSPDPEVLDDDALMQRMQRLRQRGLFRVFGISCDEHAVATKAAAHELVEVVQLAFDGTPDNRALLAALAQRGKQAVLRGFLSTAAQHGVTQETLAQSFGRALGLPAVTGLIVGTTRIAHLRQNVEAYRQAVSSVRAIASQQEPV